MEIDEGVEAAGLMGAKGRGVAGSQVDIDVLGRAVAPGIEVPDWLSRGGAFKYVHCSSLETQLEQGGPFSSHLTRRRLH